MDTNIQATYKTIDVIIRSFKKSRHENDYLSIMTSGLALLEHIPALITYAVEQEGEYRKFESGLVDQIEENGKKTTASYCETKSKATSYYREWVKAKYFIELLYEFVALSKKLASSVDRELTSH